jgi:outer membrane protein, multidrug efflux system
LSLSGLLGLNAATLGALTQSESIVHSLGVNLKWTPFNFNGIRARIGAAQARAQQSLVKYEQAVSVALEETEAAFSHYTRSAQRAALQAQAMKHAQEAERLARLRLDAGVTDLAALLDAQRDQLLSQDAWAQSQTTTATALVSVYRALGGGWEVNTP